MKKRSIKGLKLNKISISNIQSGISGGETGRFCEDELRSFLYGHCPKDDTPEPLPITADPMVCPDNSLFGTCSLGYCVETFWC